MSGSRILLASLFCVVALAAAGIAACRWYFSPPTRLFVNGQVFTMDGNDTIVEAVLIDDGRIVAAGSSADLRALAGDDAEVTDLAGKTLVPGFIDAHGHFPGSGIAALTVDLNSPPVGSITTMAQLQEALSRRAAEVDEGEWVFGIGYDDTLLAERRHPSRQDLDQVSTAHPVFILHVSGHMAVANSRGLALMGLNRDTADPEGGTFVRDADGELTGLMLETAMMQVAGQAMDFALLDSWRMLRKATAEYARAGVTTAQSGGADPKLTSALHWASRLGVVPFRLVMWPMYDNWGERLLAADYDPAADSDDQFTMGAVKLIADGSIQGYTGFLGHPYHTPYHGDAAYRGAPNIPLEKLVETVSALHAAGRQIAVHANGDAAIDNVITAFREAQRRHPRDDPRLILVHAQMAREDQLEAMKELGITPSFFSAHTYYWGDRHRDIFLGPERAARISPTRSALLRNLRFSVHLDTPVVPMNPLLLWWSTVNRLSSSGEPIGPEQRIWAMDALRAMTIDAAWQVHQEDNRGSLEPGKWADMVILSGDPLADPMEIRHLHVVETIVGGRTIYAREQD